MICIKTEIPKEICEIDDELKAIYHSQNTVCIWVFNLEKIETILWTIQLAWIKKIEKNIFQTIMDKKSNHSSNLISQGGIVLSDKW